MAEPLRCVPPDNVIAGWDFSTGAVKCLGINECKGQGQCGVPGGHACAGQNECKGKGWLQVPPEECTTKGGQVLEAS